MSEVSRKKPLLGGKKSFLAALSVQTGAPGLLPQQQGCKHSLEEEALLRLLHVSFLDPVQECAAHLGHVVVVLTRYGDCVN